jgi:hypothetical protein
MAVTLRFFLFVAVLLQVLQSGFCSSYCTVYYYSEINCKNRVAQHTLTTKYYEYSSKAFKSFRIQTGSARCFLTDLSEIWTVEANDRNANFNCVNVNIHSGDLTVLFAY